MQDMRLPADPIDALVIGSIRRLRHCEEQTEDHAASL
jgi:hypothetical protein